MKRKKRQEIQELIAIIFQFLSLWSLMMATQEIIKAIIKRETTKEEENNAQSWIPDNFLIFL